MSGQYIIAIGREFGSGGKHIGRALAKELGLNLYDRNIIEKIAAEMDIDAKHLYKYSEKKRNPFLSRTVNGHTNALEDHVIEHQFDYIRRLADSGESFVIVGRCAEEVLKGRKGLITIFVKGEREYRIKRVMEQFELNREDATEKMDRHDKTRRAYHDHYCEGKWGNAQTYDLCVESSHLGTLGTASLLATYVKKRTEIMP